MFISFIIKITGAKSRDQVVINTQLKELQKYLLIQIFILANLNCVRVRHKLKYYICDIISRYIYVTFKVISFNITTFLGLYILAVNTNICIFIFESKNTNISEFNIQTESEQNYYHMYIVYLCTIATSPQNFQVTSSNPSCFQPSPSSYNFLSLPPHFALVYTEL